MFISVRTIVVSRITFARAWSGDRNSARLLGSLAMADGFDPHGPIMFRSPNLIMQLVPDWNSPGIANLANLDGSIPDRVRDGMYATPAILARYGCGVTRKGSFE